MLFYKMAQKPIDQETYEKWVKTTLPTASLDDIYVFLAAHGIKPYIKIEDILPRIYYIVKLVDDLSGDLAWINTYFANLGLAKAIISYVLERWVDHLFTFHDYQVYERYNYDIPPALLRKAQNRIIKIIIEDIQGDNIIHRNHAINKLSKLVEHSTTLSSNFLINLSKHLGMDVYLEVSRQTQPRPPNQHKLTYSVFDVAYYMSESFGFSKERFQEILNKADEKAREYMRGFVYSEYKNNAVTMHPTLYFMLDAEMQPLNIDNRGDEWPPTFYAYHLSELTGKAHEAWAQMFSEFQVIPQ